MATNQTPEIRIKNAWLLRENASRHMHKLFGEEGSEMANHNEIDKIIDGYEQAWLPVEQKILRGMCNVMSLEFRQNIIDVYIAPWFYAFSDPLVIGVTMTGPEFVRNLTHELIHRLLTDNTSLPYDHDLVKDWKQLYGNNHSQVTLVHIPVHALHKAIINDVLKDPQIKEDDYKACVEFDGKDGDYVKSWDYVDKHGYKEVIDRLRTVYGKDD